MRQARQKAANPNMEEGGTDDFLNRMGLGDPDPSNYRKGFQGADDINESWFDGVESVGISAGASTPDNLIEDVITKVKLFSKIKVKEEIYG